jgi:hypothetical protein
MFVMLVHFGFKKKKKFSSFYYIYLFVLHEQKRYRLRHSTKSLTGEGLN